ncbi:hypothetical protein QCA50_007179 [Cerrena zonata]|uniref:Uncharacterized protein n=1 Tax=Cerrena zonata TaxID=2478898 RepID=A0AAW0GCX8_9APHY
MDEYFTRTVSPSVGDPSDSHLFDEWCNCQGNLLFLSCSVPSLVEQARVLTVIVTPNLEIRTYRSCPEVSHFTILQGNTPL